MNMTTRVVTLATLLAALLAAAALPSCMNHDTVDGPVKRYLTDIATYAGADSAGGTLFELQRADDSPLVRLSWPGRFKDDVALNPGQRLLIQYYPLSGVAYQTGPIELRGASLITCDTIRQGAIGDFPQWNRDKVYVYSLWRTGQYLNMHCRLAYSTTPRTFALVVDDSTASAARRQAYVVRQLDTVAPGHDREYYVSWWIGPVWRRDDVRALDVHVANSNMPQTVYTFSKQP